MIKVKVSTSNPDSSKKPSASVRSYPNISESLTLIATATAFMSGTVPVLS